MLCCIYIAVLHICILNIASDYLKFFLFRVYRVKRDPRDDRALQDQWYVAW